MIGGIHGHDKQRLRRVVHAVEQVDVTGSPRAPRRQVVNPEWQTVRVTSTTQTSGRYPGKVVRFKASDGTWEDLAGDVWLIELTGAALAVQRYAARRAGDANGRPVFVVVASSTVFSGARVYHNVNQSIIHGFNTVLAFNSERFDTDGYHDLVTNNSRLTVPSTGKYLIGGHVQFAAVAGGPTRRELHIRGYYGSTTSLAESNDATELSVCALYDLTGGTWVQLEVYQNSGAALNVLSSASISPEFWIMRVGGAPAGPEPPEIDGGTFA
jgi:hypothetical protein